jgi:hypothetical protein
MKTSFLRVLTVGLLLGAFCAGWGHIHAPEQDRIHAHACLLCKWAGDSAPTVDGPVCLLTLPVSGFLSILSDPPASRVCQDLPCGRSPPAVSFS